MNSNNLATSFFLGIPLPPLGLGFELSLLDDFFTDEACSFVNSSYPHLTVLAPRPMVSEECLLEIRAIVAQVASEEICIETVTFHEPDRIVGCPQTDWLRQLHAKILGLSDLPPSNSEWEGSAYNPHISIARTKDRANVGFVQDLLRLPARWTPTRLDLFVKREGRRGFREEAFFPFLNDLSFFNDLPLR